MFPPAVTSEGKKTMKEKSESEKQEPSDDDLRKATCEILKEVDFNTATFSDILMPLAKRFHIDLSHLTSRKALIKLTIQEEVTKIADEEDEEDEEEHDETDKKHLGGESLIVL